jgi:hypothetical protein
MLKSLARVFFILLGVDVILFFCAIATAMTDGDFPSFSCTFLAVKLRRGLSARTYQQWFSLFPSKAIISNKGIISSRQHCCLPSSTTLFWRC